MILFPMLITMKKITNIATCAAVCCSRIEIPHCLGTERKGGRGVEFHAYLSSLFSLFEEKTAGTYVVLPNFSVF